MTAHLPRPRNIHLHRKSKELELVYTNNDGGGNSYRLSCEYLRVYSPSAEVRGHGEGQEVLQTGKVNVNITGLQSVGHYALQIIFDDGHDSGLYSWDYLYQLATEQAARWQDYLQRLHEQKGSRDPQIQVLAFDPEK
ncbi:MAG: gamma-butyrobetaine hydroxylase-like domain-containing protein [Parahaliea sp.]